MRVHDKELDKTLAPFGFKRVPKTNYFIRLCGDGVFQGAFWDWAPAPGYSLNLWVDSIWQDPESLFNPYFSQPKYTLMQNAIAIEDFILDDDERLVFYRRRLSPQEQLQVFETKFLPYLLQCNTQQRLFALKETVQKISVGRKDRIYWAGNDINLALRLREREGALLRIEAKIQQRLLWIDWGRESLQEAEFALSQQQQQSEIKALKEHVEMYRKKIDRCENEILYYQQIKTIIDDPDAIEKRLQTAKKKNLEQYGALMKGKENAVIEQYQLC